MRPISDEDAPARMTASEAQVWLDAQLALLHEPTTMEAFEARGMNVVKLERHGSIVLLSSNAPVAALTCIGARAMARDLLVMADEALEAGLR